MRFIPLLGLVLLIALTYGHQVKIRNNCPFTVWIGAKNNEGITFVPERGGFRLNQGATRNFMVPIGWGGRFWGRTRCDAKGHCETGDCGNKIECQGAGGEKPVSLAEIRFDGDGGQDFYDISLVDGFNLPISMAPLPGTFTKRSGNKYDCTKTSCPTDINARCPNELRNKNSAGNTVACASACTKFETDQYCCRNAHDKPETCKSTDWPVNYPAKFKEACPEAYSYAYDDQKSTYTCKGITSGSTGYEIVMCP